MSRISDSGTEHTTPTYFGIIPRDLVCCFWVKICSEAGEARMPSSNFGLDPISNRKYAGVFKHRPGR